MLPPNAVLPYDSTHASIPAGWTRDTDFDAKYLKATTSDWGSTGGSSTHGHTSPSHTHTYTSNSHVHSTGIISGNNNTVKNDGRHKDSPPYDVVEDTHEHGPVNSGVMSSPSITSAVSSIGTTSNEVSRYHFVFIKANGYSLIPQSSVILRNDTNTRPNCTHFDASNARYLKGASTGQDAGSAVDVTTHTHTQSHSHTLEHTHGAVSSGNANSGVLGGGDVDTVVSLQHSHTTSFGTHSEVVSNTTAVPVQTVNLAYQELHFWKANTNAIVQVGDIIIYTESVLPVGWEDLGYDDVYIKGKSTGGSLGTGGALTHTHTGITHSHTGSSHTHSWSTSTASSTNAYRNGGSSTMSGPHAHLGTTAAGTNSTTGSTELTISTDNHEPPFIKVRFLRATPSALFAGAPLIAFL